MAVRDESQSDSYGLIGVGRRLGVLCRLERFAAHLCPVGFTLYRLPLDDGKSCIQVRLGFRRYVRPGGGCEQEEQQGSVLHPSSLGPRACQTTGAYGPVKEGFI